MADYIIKDSSVWQDPNAMMEKDYSIRIGIVRDHVFYEESGDTRYIVEVWKNNRIYPMTCIRTSRFGGVYNYEEYTYRGFKPGQDEASAGNYSIVPGDMVIVCAADGNSREGVILGSMNHIGREQMLPTTGDIAYVSEFNGIQTIVNKQGEQRTMFKGMPTNIDALDVPPTGEPIPAPEYDLEVGGTYTLFDKTGSYTISDNASEDPQSIFMDKTEGKLVITSGKTILEINKKEETYTITNKITTFTSADEFNIETKKTVIKSSEAIEAEAADIKTKGEWVQEGNIEIDGNQKVSGNTTIDANLTADGTVSLGGGANPLVYDIILTIGTGNLGAPVISNHVFLKTVKTKAT